MTSQTLSVGNLLVKRYRILSVLGQGSFGVTYLAVNLMTQVKCVIKEYLPTSAIRSGDVVAPRSQADTAIFEWGLRRFYDEANTLCGINHLNIVKVIDLFEVNGTAYFVMPYLGKRTLKDWAKDNPKPSESLLLSILIPLLEGLKYIHKKQLLHRDIKPENILIADGDVPVLIDFGAARYAIGRKSKVFTRILTPHFAPYEQYSSNVDFNEALDLYGLAASFYQIITNTYPPLATDRIESDAIIVLANSFPYNQYYSQHFLRTIDINLSVYAKDRHNSADEMQMSLMGLAGDTIASKNEAIYANESHNDKEYLVWQQACSDNTLDAYENYCVRYPSGQFIGKAMQAIDEHRIWHQKKEWQLAVSDNTLEGYRHFIEKYPRSKYVGTAFDQIAKIESYLAHQATQSQFVSVMADKPPKHQRFFTLTMCGRMGRLRAWAYVSLLFACWGTMAVVAGLLLHSFGALLLFFLISSVHALVFAVRRGHDIDKPAIWTIFIVLSAILGFVLVLETVYVYVGIGVLFGVAYPLFCLMFQKGNRGVNDYGEPDNLYNKRQLIAYIPLSILPIAFMVVISILGH